jgi:Ser/Thr protein kinase RdoA (MazF antagonist)
MAAEETLQGGNLSLGIARVGNEVHRPTGPWTPAVHALLGHLEREGFDGAPRVLGFDDEGREVVEFLEGTVPWHSDHSRLLGSDDAVRRVGRLLRSFHEAVAGFPAVSDAVWRYPEMQADSMPFAGNAGLIVCHNDPTAWNLVVGRERWAFIDWDAAGPRPPIWDLAYCAIGVTPIRRDASDLGWSGPVPVVRRLLALAEGYGLDMVDLIGLPDAIVARARSSFLHMQRRAQNGIAPWDELWRNGHGATWAATLAFAEESAAEWSRQLRLGQPG